MLTQEDIARAEEIGRDAGYLNLVALAVAEAAGINEDEIMGPSRVSHIAQARQLAYYVAHQRGYSIAKIARHFKRDPSTVTHGVNAEAARRVK